MTSDRIVSDRIIPPAWWLARINAGRAERGQEPLTALDPLAMALWHMVITEPRQQIVLITAV